VRRENTVYVDETQEFLLNKRVYLKPFFKTDYHILKNCVWVRCTLSQINYYFEVIFIFDDIIIFFYKGNLYFMDNQYLDLHSWTDEKFDEMFLNNIKNNNFMLD